MRLDGEPEGTDPGPRGAFAFDAETEEVGEIGIFKEEWRRESLRVYENARLQALADLEAEKAAILEQARVEAQESLASAMAAAMTESEKSRREGEIRGFSAGMERASFLLASIESTLAEADRIRENAFLEAEHELVDLAILIARKVIAIACEDSRAVVAQTVSKSLSAISGARPRRLSVSPRDLDAVISLLDAETGARGMRVEADPSIPPGGCVLETEAGWMDARIESMLAAVEGSLRQPGTTPKGESGFSRTSALPPADRGG